MRRPPSDAPGVPAPRKRFGQHFLTDPRILARIADALGIRAGDAVVEIGPGRGALTGQLVDRVGPSGRLTAIEVDRDLAAHLRQAYAGRAECEIVERDVLDGGVAPSAGSPYLLAGNIPYNITTPIIFQALKAPRAERMVFLVQREVAERIAAPPGSEAYGALSANVQALATVEMLFRVAAGAFTPPPRVESAVIRLVPLATPVVTPAEEEPFRLLVQSLFSFRRKQLARGVRDACAVSAEVAAQLIGRAGLTPTDRPEVLSPGDFARLLRAWRA
jgi:16S rRNA (adenine1518-N6/adenine1519-N6)-dimethyltransferase